MKDRCRVEIKLGEYFKHLFDWSIKEVKGPNYVWQGNKIGYEVEVVYNYHKPKKKFFRLVDEGLSYTYGLPELAVKDYYEKMLKKQRDTAKQR